MEIAQIIDEVLFRYYSDQGKSVPKWKTKKGCFYFIDDDNNKTYHTHQESGDIFAFPPWRIHGVDPVKEDGIDRLIVGGNIMLRSYKGDKMTICCEKVDQDQCGHRIWRYEYYG